MADMHVPPSELGIDMSNAKNIFRFNKVHRFMKLQESLQMQSAQTPKDDNPHKYVRSAAELEEMFK